MVAADPPQCIRASDEAASPNVPPYCLGHVGYSVVPWKRGRGYAKQALAEMLERAAAEGLRDIEITTRVDNEPSQRVILANGGVLDEGFTAPAALGGHRHLRYRVQLTHKGVACD